jgi:hypothetical protein
MRLVLAALLSLCLAPRLATGEEAELSRAADKLYDTARSAARSSKLRDRHYEKLREALANVGAEELSAVIAALRADEKPGKSMPEVLGYLEREYAERIFGEEAVKRIPDLVEKLTAADEAARADLLGKSLMLEDLRLARNLAVAAAFSSEVELRIRAASALGDLLDLGAGTEAVGASLTKMLDDPSPAVRALACRRAFAAAHDPVFPWATAHLGDDAKAKVSVLGRDEEVCPGAEALEGLKETTRIEDDLIHRRFLLLSEDERETVVEQYRNWWKQRGETFPPPGFFEAPFRREASEVRETVFPENDTQVVVRLWSHVDRTNIRFLVDELRSVRRSDFGWTFDFAAKYMAEGMRRDTGEGYARDVPARHRWVLARKKLGCLVAVFQPLLEGRTKLRLSLYEPKN